MDSVLSKAVFACFLLIFTSTTETEWLIVAKRLLFSLSNSILFFLNFNCFQNLTQSFTGLEKLIKRPSQSFFLLLLTTIHNSFVHAPKYQLSLVNILFFLMSRASTIAYTLHGLMINRAFVPPFVVIVLICLEPQFLKSLIFWQVHHST